MYKEQLGARHGGNPCTVTRLLRTQLRRLASSGNLSVGPYTKQPAFGHSIAEDVGEKDGIRQQPVFGTIHKGNLCLVT